MPRIPNKLVLAIGAILFLFFMINLDPTMGSIFAMMFAISIGLQVLDKNVSYVFERDGNNKLNSLVYAVIAYVCFLFLGMFITKFGFGATLNFYSENMATFFSQYSKPAFAESKILMFAAWGLLIPLAETMLFFSYIPEAMFDAIKVKYGKLSEISTLVIIAISSVIFTLFHSTAKGIQNNQALLMTFLFAVISIILVVQFKQVMEAVLLHMITNSIAVAISLGISLSPILLIAVVSIIIYIIMAKVPLKKLRIFRA